MRNMEVDHMTSNSLYVSFIWKFYILFFEIDLPRVFYFSNHFMLTNSSECLSIFPLQLHIYLFSIKKFLYFICLFESHTSLIFGSFFIVFTFFHELLGELFCHLFWDEEVASLSSRHFDHFSFSSHMSNILEEFNRDF